MTWMSLCKVGQKSKQNCKIKWLLKSRKRCCLVFTKYQKTKCKFALQERNGKKKTLGGIQEVEFKFSFKFHVCLKQMEFHSQCCWQCIKWTHQWGLDKTKVNSSRFHAVVIQTPVIAQLFGKICNILQVCGPTNLKRHHCNGSSWMTSNLTLKRQPTK